MPEKISAIQKYLFGVLFSIFLLTGCAAQVSGDNATVTQTGISGTEGSVDLSQIPEYDGEPYIIINNDSPFFTEDEMTAEPFVSLSDLDSLGRCGAGVMCAGQEIMPTGERGSIGSIKPSGWVQAKYPDVIEEKPSYLYNRAHILMWALSGINDDERGLITGTRYLNIEGMLPNEEQVIDYIEATGEHVMYRVTPIFSGDNLLADGILMEAKSVESDGFSMCRYAYNVQPGISIDYSTGESWIEGESEEEDSSSENERVAYIGNSNSKVFHKTDCPSVKKMKEKNKVYFRGLKEEIVEDGYVPCQLCNP